MDELLKGNYKLEYSIKETADRVEPGQEIAQELKKRALASLGGSMVYVDRDHLVWDGNE